MTTGKPSAVPTQDELADSLDVTWTRSQFPALSQTVDGLPAAFFDSPGGTQVPQNVLDAISDYSQWRGFLTWDGNYYALNLTERLDVEKDRGFLRIGPAHYNTAEEVDRFLQP
jgi:selenocysteine lyase/cysteine desulfurase